MRRVDSQLVITELVEGRTAVPIAALALSPDGLDEHDLIDAFGSSGQNVIEALERAGELVRDGQVIKLRGSTATTVHDLVATQPAILKSVEAFAERKLHGRPADPRALLLFCSAVAASGDPGHALAALHEHVAARMLVPMTALERFLRRIASVYPGSAGAALALLAREQLRWGDYEGARRTVNEVDASAIDPEDRDRLQVMRAQVFVRSGQPLAAREALEHVVGGSKIGLAAAIGLLELAILRGELVESRRSLLRLASQTRSHPTIDARRMTALGLSYLFEERYEIALGWVQRAKVAATKRSQVAPDPLTGVVDILAKLGLDRIDTAEALLTRDGREFAREPLGRGITRLYRAAILWRRGDFEACLALATSEVDEVDQLGDKVARAVIVRYLGRAALGLGDIERAERFFRTTSGTAREPGLEVLEPLANMDAVLLAEATGARDLASQCAAKALAQIPRSPYARIESWFFSQRDPALPRWAGVLPGTARAFAAMRAAERALACGAFEAARRELEIAEAWYRGMGARHELARSLVMRAELLARTHTEPDRLVAVLSEAASIADARRYVPLQIATGLVRAFIADRRGDIDGYVAAMTVARERAGEALADASLAAAVRRVGLAPVPPRYAHDPWMAMVTRLGLARPADTVARSGDAIFVLAAGERPEIDVELEVDVSRKLVASSHGTTDLAKQPLLVRLLEVLALAGPQGCSLEQLYLRAWGATTYHELRQRNTIHVALNRLRNVLKPLVGHSAIEIHAGQYRLSPATRVLVRHTLDGDDWRGRIGR